MSQSAGLLAMRRRSHELGRLARTDDLTGLGNARALWHDLPELLAIDALALMILDLDHFKEVNDRHGHAVGDAVLRTAGAAIRSVVGDNGRPYRYGGEELVVLMPGAGEQAAAGLAERIRARVASSGAGLPA